MIFFFIKFSNLSNSNNQSVMNEIINHGSNNFNYIFVFSPDCLANPCSNASVLPSLFKRNVGYTVKPGEARLCDNYLADGWYTISSSYAVATSNKACGTWFTWYINGNNLFYKHYFNISL